MTIIAFIVIFGTLVTAHEMGHFLLAKKNGIRVNEFFIGMGPTLLKKQKGETLFSLKLLPIGGACVFEGEDGVYGSDTTKEIPADSFQSASVWGRISCVVAGPAFNIILAFFLSLILIGMTGSDKPTIETVMDGYPAAEAGIQGGDTIKALNGGAIKLYREITLFSYFNQGETVIVTYERGGESYNATITPRYSDETGTHLFGFQGGTYIEPTGFEVIEYAYYEVRYSLISTVKSLAMMVQGKVSKDDVAGPVGMAVFIDDAIEATSPYGTKYVILTMINIAILLSVNLGVLNLLPIPALDGGRLMFLLLEAVRGKPISPEREGVVHFIGFVALMVLMGFIVINDLSRIF